MQNLYSALWHPDMPSISLKVLGMELDIGLNTRPLPVLTSPLSTMGKVGNDSEVVLPVGHCVGGRGLSSLYLLLRRNTCLSD